VNDSRGGEYGKGKFPLKEKKSRWSIYDEIEEDEDFGYSNIQQKESVEDYFEEDEDFGEFDEEFDFADEYDDYEDDEY
jgi:hypothetical protein